MFRSISKTWAHLNTYHHINRLRGGNSKQRIRAAKALSTIQSPKAIDSLFANIRDDNLEVFQVKLQALADCNATAEQLIQVCFEALFSNNAYIRRFTHEKLIVFGINRKDIIKKYAEALNNPSKKLRKLAVEALLDCHDAAAIDFILESPPDFFSEKLKILKELEATEHQLAQLAAKSLAGSVNLDALSIIKAQHYKQAIVPLLMILGQTKSNDIFKSTDVILRDLDADRSSILEAYILALQHVSRSGLKSSGI